MSKEHVIPKEQTARFRPMLEAMNSSETPSPYPGGVEGFKEDMKELLAGFKKLYEELRKNNPDLPNLP